MWNMLKNLLDKTDGFNVWAIREQLGSEPFKETDTIRTWASRIGAFSK
jgi:hypothetical protein